MVDKEMVDKEKIWEEAEEAIGMERIGEDRDCGFYPIIVAPKKELQRLLGYLRRVQEDACRAEARPLSALVEPTIVDDGAFVAIILERFGCSIYARVQRRIMFRLTRNLEKNFPSARLIDGDELVEVYKNRYAPKEVFEKV